MRVRTATKRTVRCVSFACRKVWGCRRLPTIGQWCDWRPRPIAYTHLRLSDDAPPLPQEHNQPVELKPDGPCQLTGEPAPAPQRAHLLPRYPPPPFLPPPPQPPPPH